MKKRKQPRGRPFWVGNRDTKELHRCIRGATHPPECNFDAILEENKAIFRTAREARDAGYDVAAYCTAKFNSQR